MRIVFLAFHFPVLNMCIGCRCRVTEPVRWFFSIRDSE